MMVTLSWNCAWENEIRFSVSLANKLHATFNQGKIGVDGLISVLDVNGRVQWNILGVSMLELHST